MSVFMSLCSYLMKIHKNEFYKLFSWAWTHDMSLDSYLWRFIEIFLWAFIVLTPEINFNVYHHIFNLITVTSLQLQKFSQIFYSFNRKFRSQRAALKKQWGRMWPAGRQFDMPIVNFIDILHKRFLYESTFFAKT